LSLGLEQAGFDVVAAVEYDPVHAAVHAFNFPLTEVLCADVSAPLPPERLLGAVATGLAKHGRDAASWDRTIDLIAGGPPCQGFSWIGKRLIDDKRNQLVFHFFRLVSALEPRCFVMENVPGMAQGGHASILDELIAEFEEAGYRFPDNGTNKYRILNASDFGVPQDRRRLFLIGTREDQDRLVEPPSPSCCPVPKRSGMPARSECGLPKGPSVWDAIGDLPDADEYPALETADEVRLSRERLARIEEEASEYARRLMGLAVDSQDFSHPRQWDRALLTSSTRTKHTQESVDRFYATSPGATEPVSRFYRLDPAGLCNTLRAGSGSERGAFTSPRPLHPKLSRVLTNREAARLHSYPDWFRVHATKWHGFRQIGNSVAPLVGRAVGASVASALGVVPTKPQKLLPLGDTALLTMTMSEATTHFEADREYIPAPRIRGASATLAASKDRMRDVASSRFLEPAA
jgi:DNA (cytosine-5)-methyltransferase 1